MELSVTEQSYKAVLAVISDGRTVTSVARDWDVSRQTLHGLPGRSGGIAASRAAAPCTGRGKGRARGDGDLNFPTATAITNIAVEHRMAEINWPSGRYVLRWGV